MFSINQKVLLTYLLGTSYFVLTIGKYTEIDNGEKIYSSSSSMNKLKYNFAFR